MNGSILIVARNNLALTKQAVKSALLQDVPCDVLVADNCSLDGTLDWLKSKPVATAFYATQNSLAACWNRGIRTFWRAKRDSDRVLVINNDVVLRSDTYRLLASTNLPFITGVSVDDVARMGTALDRDMDSIEPTRRAHPDFSCFMISKYVTDKIGWFDETYFPAYCEDCDYHVRMHRAGIEALCVDVPFLHLGAATLKNADPGEQIRIQRYAAENREKFKRKYGCLPGTKEYEGLFAL